MRIDPVAQIAAHQLERHARERRASTRMRPMQCVPVDGRAAHPQFGECVPLPRMQQGVDKAIACVAGQQSQHVRSGRRLRIAHEHTVATLCGLAQISVERIDECGGVACHQRHAVATGDAAGLRGIRQIGEAGRRHSFSDPFAHERNDGMGVGPQSFRTARRQHEHRGLIRRPGFDRHNGRRFDDHECVGAAHAEGIDAGVAPAIAERGPGAGLGRETERRTDMREAAVDASELGAGRDFAVTHAQQHLDQRTHARCGFHVADVGLAADGAIADGIAGTAQSIGQRLELDRVAQFGSGAVGFDVADIHRRDSGIADAIGSGFFHDPQIGHELSGSGTGVTDPRCADHAVDMIAVRECASERLEHRDAHALAGDQPVRGLIEGAFLAIRGQHVHVMQQLILAVVQAEIHAADQRHFAIAGEDRLPRQMQRGQGCRTCGRHGEAGAAEVHQERKPVGQFAADRSRAEVVGRTCLQLGGDAREVVVHRADEHAHARCRQRFRRIGRVLDRAPGGAQQHAQLWIGPIRFGMRHAEQLRVEQIDVGDEAALVRDRLARTRTAEIQRRGETAVVRNPGQAIVARTQMIPIMREVRRRRKLTGDPDDRDALVGHGRSPCPQRKRAPGRNCGHARRAGNGARDRRCGLRRGDGGRCRRWRSGDADTAVQRFAVLRDQITRHPFGGVVFEQRCLGQPLELGAQQCVQFQHQYRVHAALLETGAAVDGLDARFGDGGHVRLDVMLCAFLQVCRRSRDRLRRTFDVRRRESGYWRRGCDRHRARDVVRRCGIRNGRMQAQGFGNASGIAHGHQHAVVSGVQNPLERGDAFGCSQRLHAREAQH